MRLFVVRHAEAAPGDPDDLRPLTERGREAARELGERLAHEGIAAVVSSPLLRARETAHAIARASDLEPVVDERLAPGATWQDVRVLADEQTGTTVAVGHQPDCSEIVLAITGEVVDFTPGAVYEVEL